MLSILTPPAALPLDVLELRAQVRLGSSGAEDAMLRRYLAAATTWGETLTQRSFVTRRLQLTLPAFRRCIELERGPLIRIADVCYRDSFDEWQTVSPAEYMSGLAEQPALLTHRWNSYWPTVLPEPGRVRVRFDAGYIAPLTVDQAAGTLAVRGPWADLAVGSVVRLSNSGGALPAPLEPLTDYAVQAVVAPGVVRLAATPGGPALVLTTPGSGTSYIGALPDNIAAWLLLRVGAMFEHRESEVEIERGQLVSLPFIDRLLDGSTTLSC